MDVQPSILTDSSSSAKDIDDAGAISSLSAKITEKLMKMDLDFDRHKKQRRDSGIILTPDQEKALVDEEKIEKQNLIHLVLDKEKKLKQEEQKKQEVQETKTTKNEETETFFLKKAFENPETKDAIDSLKYIPYEKVVEFSKKVVLISDSTELNQKISNYSLVGVPTFYVDRFWVAVNPFNRTLVRSYQEAGIDNYAPPKSYFVYGNDLYSLLIEEIAQQAL